MEIENTFIVGYLVGTVPFGVILLKGNVRLFWAVLLVYVVVGVVGLFLVGSVFAIAASARLGKPNSWWARRFYDPEKMAAARDRFPDVGVQPATGAAVAGAVLLVALPVAALAANTLTRLLSCRLDAAWDFVEIRRSSARAPNDHPCWRNVCLDRGCGRHV